VISCWARVVEVVQLAEALVLLWFEAPEVTRLAHPGQFLMVQCGASDDPYLPRPFSYSRARQVAGGVSQLSLLIQVVGRGSLWLSRRRSGDTFTVFGPLGHGLTLRADTRNLLLVSHGVRLAPLLYLVDQAITRGVNVTLIQGGAPSEPAFPVALLPPQLELELVDTDPDGRVSANLLPEYLRWSDQVVVAGEEPLLRQVAAELKRLVSRRSVQAVVWQPLACGTGACAGCPIETRRRGSRLLCRDGPRFELSDLF
jgi:dihydroorotate dehydrogenase electron transfer subunit